VPLLATAGRLRRRRDPPARIHRIGILKSTGIGDMVVATGVVRDVTRAFPGAEVVVFAGPDNEAVARLLPDVRVVGVPMGRPWTAIARLRAEKLDVLLDLGQWSRVEAVCALASGARFTVGFDTAGQRRHGAYDRVVAHSAGRHELDNYRRLVAELGVESKALPRLPAPDGDLPAPAPRSPYVVFHLWPGGLRSDLKEWPAESWRELAGRVIGQGYSVVLTGSPADAERTAAFVSSCNGARPDIENLAGRCGIDGLARLLEHSACVVSVNTGVMHLAAAVGAPTVALNGPTSERRWGPIGERVTSVNSELPGCGYLNLGFEYDGQRTDCMEGISVDRVADAALEIARRD
jgi:ADP-heptose:LPS heptosyltransferase